MRSQNNNNRNDSQASNEQHVAIESAPNTVTVASEQALTSASQKLIEQNIESYKELAK